MSAVEAVISDADGTLVDTVLLIRHGHYETATTFLAQHGVPSEEIPDYEEYETLLNKIVGGSARQTLERTVKAIYEDKTHHIEGVDYDELNKLLDPIQDRLAPEYVKSFPGLADTLTQIGSLGIKVAIFSSGTPHHIVRNFGIALGDKVGDYAALYRDKTINDQAKLSLFSRRLEEVFHIPKLTVVTCDDVGERTKPDPLTAQIAMERLGVQPSESLVLGDHVYDIQAGINAGVSRRVGITHGFDDAAVLREAGATDVIDELSKLIGLITKY
ncbi:MAG: HAD family hydrolase [Patescibacteria group bacterium]